MVSTIRTHAEALYHSNTAEGAYLRDSGQDHSTFNFSRRSFSTMPINGHPTISDAVAKFGVSAKTIQSYINKGWIDPPPTVPYGTKDLQIFPDNYVDKALRQLDAMREKKREARAKKAGRV